MAVFFSPESRQLQQLRYMAMASAWAAVFIGIGIVALWHSRSAWALEQAPWLFKMRYNTALLSLAGGIGLLAALSGKQPYSRAAAAFILIISLLTLLEYLTGINFGIDEALMEDYANAGQPLPGRLAPNTAIAFLCVGIVLLLTQHGRAYDQMRSAAMEILSFVAFALGGVAIMGYLTHMELAYYWASTTRMAIPTAISCMMLGIGFAALSWYGQKTRIALGSLWLPAAACFIAFLFDLITPFELAAGFLYIPLVFCSLWFTRPHTTIVFAGIASLLAVLGYFSSDMDKWALSFGWMNRLLSIMTIWFVAVLIYKFREQTQVLQDSSSNLSAMVDSAIDGIITIDSRGTVQSMNPATSRIFGYRPEEVIGRNVKMLMPEPYHSEHDGYLRNYLSTGTAKIIGIGREVAAQRKNGEIFPIELGVGEMRGSDKRLFVGTVRDISERKRAESNRQQYMMELRAVLDSAIDGIITIDSQGTVQSMNPATSRIFGYRPEEVIGRNVKMLMPEPYHSEHDGYLRNYLSTGTAKIIGIGREVAAQRKNGEIFPIELGVNEMQVGDKRLFVGTVRDISERKRAESERQAYMAELERINKDLDAFVYVASHDLKSPLRAIDNLSQWVVEDLKDLDGENRDRLVKMRGRVQRMENLLDDILEYSRAGRNLETTAAVNASALVAEVAEVLNVPEGFTIRADASLDGVTVPRMPIKQVLHNLISNAVKHHDKKNGTITVSAKDEGDFYRFAVADDGPGIPKQYHARVFEMFQKLKPRDEVEGSGIGLSLVRKIITRFGGEVTLESEEGKGAVFCFTWPRRRQPQIGEAA